MKNSSYSKMFLVLPSIYDKVLKCIDEKDQKVLDQLNIQKDDNMDGSRASEKYFEDVASNELNESAQSDANQSSEFIDPPYNIAEQTFGSDQNDNTNIEVDDQELDDQNDQGNIHPPGENSNPLKNDCAQPDVQDQFIPQVLHGFKRRSVVHPKIPKRLQQKSILNNPKTIKQNPNRTIPKKNVTRNFICNYCTPAKPFKSTYHLNRHENARHKDLVALKSQKNIENAPVQQPFVPQPGTSQSQFNTWQEPNIPLQRHKRDSGAAKLKYTPRPNKMRPDDYDEWN